MRFRRQPSSVVAVAPLNAGVALLDGAALSVYALTFIDSVGVIERATFGDVSTKAHQWVHLLRGQGLEPGDPVVVLAGRDREWRAALIGVLQAGGVVVPCPASAPVAELEAVANHVRGKRVFFVSARARSDLRDAARGQALSAHDLDPRGAAQAAHPAHSSRAQDVALILCTSGVDGLRSATHTHAALLAQAEAGESWLGLGQRDRIWATVADGSAGSLWLLLAAWRVGAELISIENALDPREQIELLARLRPAALWFSDAEYADHAAEGDAAAFAVGSVGRVLTSDPPGNGATTFAHMFGAQVAPVPELDENGASTNDVPDVEPAALAAPVGPVGEGEAERENAERWQAAEQALLEQERREKEQREEEQRVADEALAREEAERRRSEEERRQGAERARREEEEAQARALRGEEDRGRAGGEAGSAEDPPPKAPQQSKDERLAPGILSQISAYGGPARTDEPDARRDTA